MFSTTKLQPVCFSIWLIDGARDDVAEVPPAPIGHDDADRACRLPCAAACSVMTAVVISNRGKHRALDERATIQTQVM